MALIEITVDDKEAMAYMRGLRASLWPDVLFAAGKTIQKDALDAFRKTTRTWWHQPEFEMMVQQTGNELEIVVGTDDRIYGYVDRGTPPHIIRPKKPGYPLRFQSGYKSKTTPGVIGSKAGGPRGDFVRAMEVHHPGTKPRKFSEAIQDYMNVKAPERIEKRVNQWLGKRY